MNLHVYIDLYCERTGPGLPGEPLNAVSNVAFVLAAWLAWRALERRGGRDPLETALVTLAAGIGFGSLAFHTFASGWSLIADVAPIWTFVVVYVLAVVHRATSKGRAKRATSKGRAKRATTERVAASGWGTVIVVGGLLSIFAIAAATGDDRSAASSAPLNGSLYYLPAVAALVVVAAITSWKHHPARRYFQLATVVFVASLCLRTLDLMACDALPIGTHFGWHLLNGLMVGVLLLALVRHFPPAAESPKDRARAVARAAPPCSR